LKKIKKIKKFKKFKLKNFKIEIKIFTCIRFFPDIKFLASLTEEIPDFFIVKFEKTGSDKILHILTMGVDMLENMLESSWDDPIQLGWAFFTFHRKGLSCSCLPISKNCPIVTKKFKINQKNEKYFEKFENLMLPFEYIFYNVKSCILIDIFLCGIWAEGGVKGEVFLGFA